jgi:hypothetical protein
MVIQSASDLDNLVERFFACTLPREEWTHQAHLVVGIWCIDQYGAGETLSRLRAGIRRLNDSHGTLNSPRGGYHETVTRAYVQLLSEFSEHCGIAMSLKERVECLLGSVLSDKDILLKFYSRQTLISTAARVYWVEPDIAPLRLQAFFERD